MIDLLFCKFNSHCRIHNDWSDSVDEVNEGEGYSSSRLLFS